MAHGPRSAGTAGSNKPGLTLHVPEPRFRPGDAVDFGHIDVGAPGVVSRPDESCHPSELRDHAYGLIRVLGDDNRASGPWDPKLDPDTLRSMLGHMALTRAFDTRMLWHHPSHVSQALPCLQVPSAPRSLGFSGTSGDPSASGCRRSSSGSSG